MPKAATNLKPTDLDEIKNKLNTDKTRIEGELLKFAKKNPNVAGEYDAQIEDLGDDESENVTEVEQYALDLSLEHALEKELKDVDKALLAIKKGTYGFCKYCKQPIDAKRLKARPTSTSCVSCKNKLKSL
jgi:RNA polymerase-binding protein DksA